MPKETRSFAVLGLGGFGSTVALELARFGNRVMGADLDERKVSRMVPHLQSAIILDATDEGAMREAGIDRYDVALVAIGRDIKASILATMNLRLLGVGTIWSKASDRTHHRILSKLGADRVILPEQEMGRHSAQMLHNPAVQDYVSLGNGFSVVSIVVSEKLDGKAVAALSIGTEHDIRLLGVMRGTDYLEGVGAETGLAAGDKLILLGRRADLWQFGRRL
ncbi:MAG: TrkA family potassium uptake protein [Roseovarius sp.]|uniref:potassium channel family protein n=1 Tax=Roseovarius sp. TaxID=1486281 RepID=UPI0032EEF287